MNGCRAATVLFSVSAAFAAGTLGGATVDVGTGCEDMGEVSWSQTSLKDGTVRLSLKAKAASGCAFAGWTASGGESLSWPYDMRYAGASVIVPSETEVQAWFVEHCDDSLSFDVADSLSSFTCGETVVCPLEVDSVSFPTLTLSGLPDGLTFDPRTLTVSGTLSKPGRFVVNVSGRNASGFTFCQSFVSKVSNLDGRNLAAYETEIPVGEYFFAEFEDLFAVAAETDAVTLTGDWPPGLEWNAGWGLLYGTPTKAGVYALRARVQYADGTWDEATAMVDVTEPEPEDYGVDFEGLDALTVGDSLESGVCEIGTYANGVGIRSVSGLPKGLSLENWQEAGITHYGIVGTPLQAGAFEVSVVVATSDGDAPVDVTTRRQLFVTDFPDAYLLVQSLDASRGSVSGGGPICPFATVTLTAIPNTGFFFAGWVDEDGEATSFDDGSDSRTASVTLLPGEKVSLLSFYARFVTSDEDADPSFVDLDDLDLDCPSGETFEWPFRIDSQTLPSVTFSGLPDWLTCTHVGNEYLLAYDPEIAGELFPGRYEVIAEAVNASGASCLASFAVTVPHLCDEHIDVFDDYGEFVPDDPIDPIDLSDAVDFAKGETLSVSGLPPGLTYNPWGNTRKGVSAHTITGTPTFPGSYVVVFDAEVVVGLQTNESGLVSNLYEKRRATASMVVLPFPELAIDVDEDAAAAGCRVSGAGNHRRGTKVSLKATAAKGWVFAGWEGLDGVEGLAALNPSLSYVSGEDDLWVLACFTTVDQDRLRVAEPSRTDAGFAAEWPLGEALDESAGALIANLIETVSWPTVTVSGLPSGVKFSAKTLRLSGKPTKSGVSHVTVTVKNAGGYSFVRVLDIAVLNADGTLPRDVVLPNPAGIDFASLAALTTGVHCVTGAVVLAVSPKPATGSAVRKVGVSGLPAGLVATVALSGGGAAIEVTGTPTAPGRKTVTVCVFYADGKMARSQVAIVVQDGGSAYLRVSTSDANGGSVSGEGVYAAGATVKLVAKPAKKHVFAGWRMSDEDGCLPPFAPLRDTDGIDFRKTTVSFPFRPTDFAVDCELTGVFAAASDDAAPVISLASETWRIDPKKPSSFAFGIDSLSLPSLTVAGLPRGVTVDLLYGVMRYLTTVEAAPGSYRATITAQNVTQQKATSRTFEIRVANRVSDVIGGLDSALDAYALTVGTVLDSSRIVPTVEEGWTLSAKGLPPGLSFKNGVVTGVPSKAGSFTVTFTATKGKGKERKVETATITLCVTALPPVLTGTFTGVLTDETGAVAGTVTVTATTAGRVTVAVKTARRTVTFTAKSWDAFAENAATVAMTGRGDAACALSVAATDDWKAWQATGTVLLGDSRLSFAAQRNPYGTRAGCTAARSAVSTMVGTTEADGWTVRIKASGTVSFAGRMDGKSLSGSAVLQWDGRGAFVRYVKFIGRDSVRVIGFEFDEEGRAVSVCDSFL